MLLFIVIFSKIIGFCNCMWRILHYVWCWKQPPLNARNVRVYATSLHRICIYAKKTQVNGSWVVSKFDPIDMLSKTHKIEYLFKWKEIIKSLFGNYWPKLLVWDPFSSLYKWGNRRQSNFLTSWCCTTFFFSTTNLFWKNSPFWIWLTRDSRDLDIWIAEDWILLLPLRHHHFEFGPLSND